MRKENTMPAKALNWTQFLQIAGENVSYADYIPYLEEIGEEAVEAYLTDGSYISTLATNSTNLVTTDGVINFVTTTGSQAITTVTETSTGVAVSSEGAALTGITLASALSAVMAALGGVATGISLYEINPEFWTALSQTLLPFCYENPSQGGWDNVWNALVPTIVDENGKTYLDTNFINTIAQALVRANAFTPNTTHTVTEEEYERLNDPKLPMIINTNDNYAAWIVDDNIYEEMCSGGTSPIYGYSFGELGIFNYSCYAFCSLEQFLDPAFHRPVTEVHYLGKTYYVYNAQPYTTVDRYIPEISEYEYPYPSGAFDIAKKIAYIILFGTESRTGLQGVDKQIDATIPEEDVDISETYPDWIADGKTTYNIDSNTGAISEQQWVPISLPTTSPSAEEFNSLAPQAEAQRGTNPQTEAQQEALPSPQPAVNPQPALPNGNTGTPPLIITPTSGATVGIFHVFNPSLSELQDLNTYMWTENIAKLIAEIFNNNPVDAVIGLQTIYASPVTSGRDSIKLGYLDSGVDADVVAQQFIEIDCGLCTVPTQFQTAYDYEPYTEAYIFLPFIGTQRISAYDIVGGVVNVKYTIDVLTGVCCARIYVTKGTNAPYLLYIFNGSCASELPVTSGSRAAQLASAVSGAIGGAVGGGMVAGPYGALAGAIVGEVKGMTRGADIRLSGNISGTAGACAPRKPFIIMKHTRPYIAGDYPTFYGYPANKTVLLGNCSGYTRVKSVHVESISDATSEEKKMIENALKEGVQI